MSHDAPGNHRRFSLTEGGLTHRIGIRLGLKHPASTNISRRALVAVFVTWVPLLILSTVQGNLIGNHVAIPFLKDFAVHARFLLAVPMLILAEAILGPRMELAAHHFLDSGLVVANDKEKFEEAIEKGLQLRDAIKGELILIISTYGVTILTLTSTAVHVSTWYAVREGSYVSPTIAGWWFILLCVPLLHFLTLRWLWRLFIWGQFLWRMSRLNLQLMPIHPDLAGGLAFVGETERFFGSVLFAFSITVSGVLANGVIYDKLPLMQFAPVIAAYVVAAVAVILSPVLVFFGVLFKTKKMGLIQYGTLATEYTTSFQKKWIDYPRQNTETLLGTGDIQSLADLGNSYAFVKNMRVVPLGTRTPINLAVACLLPMAPLLLTVMPLDQVLKMALKIIL
jgi:hypothetical protein